MRHLRPRFHVRPAAGWVNDPNGPVEHEGRLHLFFQSRPRLSLSTPVEWGHASSDDGVNWVVHPSAIEPDIHPLAADGVYSGNTVSTPEGIRAYFSAFRQDRPFQTVLTALSTDAGSSFSDARVAVADPDETAGVAIYRDPFVWRDDDGWHLVVGVGLDDGSAAVWHFDSADGLDWVRSQDLARAPSPDRSPWGYMWECPQVLSDDGRTAVLVSVMDHAIGGFGPVLALSGSTGAPATAIETVSAVDQGPDFYAASVLRHGAGGAVVWGWVPEARAEDWWLDDGWAGMISLPRETRIGADGILRNAPLAALTALRVDDGTVSGDPVEVGAQFEFSVTVDPALGRQEVTLQFGDDERLLIAIDPAADSLTIDRSTASRDARADSDPVTARGVGGEVRGFVDGSVVEVFLAGGAPVTFRVYPTTPPPWRLAAPGATLRVWALRPSVTEG